MPRLRSIALLSFAIASVGVSYGCDTNAVGVDDCRDIEVARCRAAHPCDLGIDATTQDVCERFARDNCLHGLPTAEAPPAGKLNACLKAIGAAGTCAAAKGEGPGLLATSCAGLEEIITISTATVCDIIENPEQTTACGFLLAEPKPAVVVDAGPTTPSDPDPAPPVGDGG